MGSYRQPGGHLLTQRAGLVKRAAAEIGVREATGRNDGPRIALYLRSTGVKDESAWCAAFVCWVFLQEGFSGPVTPWSPALFPAARIKKIALPGDVLGIYFPEKHRIAHAGLVERADGDWVVSIEGNTNEAGSREGDGVYRKRRHIRTIYRFADWVSNRK